MCHADVDVVSYDCKLLKVFDLCFVKCLLRLALGMSRNGKEPVPEPNFNVMKKCRNFDALVEWAKSNEVPDAQSKRELLKAPPEVRVKDWDAV
jgi:hypothetical protein